MEALAVWGMGVPFLGTVLGAGVAFALPEHCEGVNRSLRGLAAGAMLASSVWSLLLPGLAEGVWPVVAGFALGMLLLLGPDRWLGSRERACNPGMLMVLAVVLHNIPEGLAVGAGYAGYLNDTKLSLADTLSLTAGIALQNLPDGAVIVLPLVASGMKRSRAFAWGVLSGAVEPVATVLMLLFAPLLLAALPALMGFAAGAMMYVVVRELIPRMGEDGSGTVFFVVGFLGILCMDVVLG